MVIGQLSVGGAEGQLRELVRGIDRQRFDPVVYSLVPAEGPIRRSIEESGVAVREVGGRGPARARRLARLLANDRIDVVHSWLFIANTYAWMARHFGVRVPLIASARNCKSQGWLHHAANAAAFRASACVVANSEEVARYVVRRYLAPPARVRVVHNGIDTARFSPRGGGDTAAPRIVTAGRMVEQKNPQLFLRAAALVHSAEPAARFVWLGDGPLRQSIVERGRAVGLGQALELPGERNDVEEWFGRATLFWLTSSWEGLPNVVLEAMACGLPVIATDVGGTRELLASGREGFLVQAGAADDLAHYTLALLRDPRLREEMGRQARRRAEQFTVQRMVRSMQDIYVEVARPSVGAAGKSAAAEAAARVVP